MKKKRKSRKKKGGPGVVLLVLVLVGVGCGIVYLARHDLSRWLQPSREKKAIVKETAKESVKEKRAVTLYFADPEGDYLIGEQRQMAKIDDLEKEAEALVSELAKGPRGKLIPTLPSRTKLLGLRLDEKGVARVNMNGALTRDHPGGTSAEMMTVYSIVNSLTSNFAEIKKVQILVEGKAIETIAGHLSLKGPLPPNPSLIKKTGKQSS